MKLYYDSWRIIWKIRWAELALLYNNIINGNVRNQLWWCVMYTRARVRCEVWQRQYAESRCPINFQRLGGIHLKIRDIYVSPLKTYRVIIIVCRQTTAYTLQLYIIIKGVHDSIKRRSAILYAVHDCIRFRMSRACSIV